MEFIKNQKIGFITNVIVAVMTIISMIVYISNVSAEYYQDMNIGVVGMLAGALVLTVIATVISQFGNHKMIQLISDICRVAAAVFIILAAVTFLGMRVESFGYIFGSNLELGNEAAQSAGMQAIIGIVLLVITWLLSVVSSFFGLGKKDA